MSNILVDSINYDVLKYKYVKEFCTYINENFYSRKAKFLRFWGIGTEKTCDLRDVYADFLKVRKLSDKNEELNNDVIDFVKGNSMSQKYMMTELDLATAATRSASQQQNRVFECMQFYPDYTKKAWDKCFGEQAEMDRDL